MGEEAQSVTTGSGVASQRGLLDELGQKFETEIHKLKGLALGTMLGVVRDMITRSAPPQLSAQLAEIVDSATAKLGGQPIRGSVLNMFEHSSAEGQGQQSRGSAERNPAGAYRDAATYGGRPID